MSSTLTSASNQTFIDDSQILPDISSHVTIYLFKTVTMLHDVYGSSSDIKELCLKASFTFISNPTRAHLSLHEYKMSDFVDSNIIPTPFPYLPDRCATLIPPVESRRHSGSGIMDDIVTAIRYTTRVEKIQSGNLVFYPPSTLEIQTWMALTWPEKYQADRQVASGWRNSVNQCLTHGQGWNFVTYGPRGRESGKIKRHLLVERAFNGSCIVGSGQCKGLNDQKVKSRNK